MMMVQVVRCGRCRWESNEAVKLNLFSTYFYPPWQGFCGRGLSLQGARILWDADLFVTNCKQKLNGQLTFL